MVRYLPEYASMKDPFDLLDTFFFRTQNEQNKPPVDIMPYMEGKTITGWKIQVAAAGYDSKKELNVSTEGQKLIISGNNISNDRISKKFKNSFKYEYTASNKLDLEKTEVDYDLGVLTVFIPVKEKELSKKRVLWGEVSE